MTPEVMVAAIDEAVSRRQFLKAVLGVGAGLLATAALSSMAGCAATQDITSTSSTDLAHNHRVTIPGADLDSPPAQKTYTTDGTTHTHTVTLTKAQLEVIKKGQAVSVTCSSSGVPAHTHTFNIQKAAQARPSGGFGY